jgi:ubiquinone biosynthesis protein UbiJ
MPTNTLSATLIGMIDTALNRWIQLDPDALSTLETMQEKVIGLHITGLELKLYFFPSARGIYTLTEYAGKPDACLQTPPASLLKLAMAENAGKVILENEAVTLEGSMGLLESFMSVISGAGIDWEELLSHVVGDILAYQTGEKVRQSKGWLDESRMAMQMNVAEYLQEESRLTPAESEVAYYMDQVDELREDAERLEARIQRLQNTVQDTNDS